MMASEVSEKRNGWSVFDWMRSTRSKAEIRAKITELVDRYTEQVEGMTLEENAIIRAKCNGMTQALDWVIKEIDNL